MKRFMEGADREQPTLPYGGPDTAIQRKTGPQLGHWFLLSSMAAIAPSPVQLDDPTAMFH